MSNEDVFVLVSIKKGQVPAVDVFSDADSAIDYAMENMFGEDWEAQMNDDEWELQGEVTDAYDTLSSLDSYRAYQHPDSGITYALHACRVDEPVEVY